VRGRERYGPPFGFYCGGRIFFRTPFELFLWEMRTIPSDFMTLRPCLPAIFIVIFFPSQVMQTLSLLWFPCDHTFCGIPWIPPLPVPDLFFYRSPRSPLQGFYFVLGLHFFERTFRFASSYGQAPLQPSHLLLRRNSPFSHGSSSLNPCLLAHPMLNPLRRYRP